MNVANQLNNNPFVEKIDHVRHDDDCVPNFIHLFAMCRVPRLADAYVRNESHVVHENLISFLDKVHIDTKTKRVAKNIIFRLIEHGIDEKMVR